MFEFEAIIHTVNLWLLIINDMYNLKSLQNNLQNRQIGKILLSLTMFAYLIFYYNLI